MASLGKEEPRHRTLESQVQNELQTLYSEPFFDLPVQEIQTQETDTFSVAPIGLFGYAFSCYLTGCVKLGIINDDSTGKSIGVFFGGIAQYLGGVFSWYQGDSYSAFLGVNYGFFNMSFLVSNIFSTQKVASDPKAKIFGYSDILWAIASIGVSTSSFNGPKANFVNNILVFLSFFFQIFESFTEAKAFTKIAGVVLLMVATCIFYITAAILINGIYKRTILPLFREGEKIECIPIRKIKQEGV